MPARPCLAAILLLAAPAFGATPATLPALPTNEPPTYKFKSSAEWMYVALDRDENTRAEGVRALVALAVVQPDLVPVLADLLERDPSVEVRSRIAGELPTLVAKQPAAWAGRIDAVLAAASDADLIFGGGGAAAAVEAAALLASADAATPEQRARTVKTLAGLLDHGPAPAGVMDGQLDALGTTAASGLASIAARDPDAARALRGGLNSSRTPVRLASISALLKADPSYKPADAAASLVAQLDALPPDDGPTANQIGAWIESNAGPGGPVAAMAPADRQSVAEAIGGVFRRLPATDPLGASSNTASVFFGLVGGLADLGPDALPAVGAARQAEERFGNGQGAETAALNRLYALQPSTRPAAGE